MGRMNNVISAKHRASCYTIKDNARNWQLIRNGKARGRSYNKDSFTIDRIIEADVEWIVFRRIAK